MIDAIPLIATAIFIKANREAFRLIVSPSQALPVTRRWQIWTGPNRVTAIEFGLYYGLTDVRPLGTWCISEIPSLHHNQASITASVHIDHTGWLTITASWQGQSLPVTVSSYGAVTHLAIGTLPIERLAVHLHAGQGHGTIERYDAYREYGLIAVENTRLLIPFVKPPERDSGLPLFESGDQVAFTIAHGQVTQVNMTMPHDPHYQHFWCDRCNKYLEYAETTAAYRDGTWGEYHVWTCNTCHAEVNPVTRDSAHS